MNNIKKKKQDDIRHIFIKYSNKILDKDIFLPCPCCHRLAKYCKGEMIDFTAGRLCDVCSKHTVGGVI